LATDWPWQPIGLGNRQRNDRILALVHTRTEDLAKFIPFEKQKLLTSAKSDYLPMDANFVQLLPSVVVVHTSVVLCMVQYHVFWW
jgi:hypothetical protein